MKKSPINAENFMEFFEKNMNVKFVDVESGTSALEILAKQKLEKKTDYDIWLEQQDKETQSAHKMQEC